MEPSRRLIDRWPVYYLRRYPAVLAANGFRPRRVAEIPRSAIHEALRLGYLRWTRALSPWCRNRDVLDVGCGMGLHGIGFLLEGARSYLGIDPDVKVRSPLVKDQYTGRRVDCGWTPEALMAACPRFEMVRGRSDELEGGRRFDLAAMHNATEHLTDLDAVLGSVHRLLRPGGVLVFNHHNWCAWNGHHQPPKTIDTIDPDDPAQARHVDWAHLSAEHPPDSYVMTKLNRLALDEVRAITEKRFAIEIWRPTRSTPRQGGGRLTPGIRARHPGLGEADFTTQNVFVVARRRDGG